MGKKETLRPIMLEKFTKVRLPEKARLTIQTVSLTWAHLKVTNGMVSEPIPGQMEVEPKVSSAKVNSMESIPPTTEMARSSIASMTWADSSLSRDVTPQKMFGSAQCNIQLKNLIWFEYIRLKEK